MILPKKAFAWSCVDYLQFNQLSSYFFCAIVAIPGVTEVDDVLAAEFRKFEENQARNFCSWAKLNIRRRDTELEPTTAHHLGGLLPPGVGCQDFIVLIYLLLFD